MTDSTPPAVPEPTPYAAPPAAPVAPSAGWNVLSIISLVTAIVGIGLAAVITGHIALSQIKKTGEQGNVLAIIGLILGYLEILAGIIFIIFWGIFLAAAGTSGGFNY
jgi:hypothetical protein